MRIVFMGTTGFGIPTLEAVLKRGHTLAGIVSTPPTKKGRGLDLFESPIVVFAKQNGLSPVFVPLLLSDASFEEELKKLDADAFVVAAFRILPSSIFTIPRLGTFNIHTSLLPMYRGAAPVERAIEAGERETGVTIFRIDAGIDTGAILLTKSTPIGPTETSPDVSKRLSLLGAEAVVEVLEKVESGAAIFQTQDNAKACGAPKLSKVEGKIAWNDSANSIFNRIRAFKPFPGTYTFLQGLRVSIEWGAVVEPSGAPTMAPGTIIALGKDGVEVECGNGRLLITEVKPEGKKTMSASDFSRGRGLGVGSRFE
jgi:methionyl-tRNA formyltransferase